VVGRPPPPAGRRLGRRDRRQPQPGRPHFVLDDAEVWGQPYMALQTVLADAKPILSPARWPNPNDAWRAVAANLREVVARRRG